jgi:DNA-binding transcriptional MerR regulator
MLRLQHILFLRELGLSLESIQAVIDRPDFDLVQSLEAHRTALNAEQGRLAKLTQTVERTILYLKGKLDMENKELFAGFSDEKQQEYEEEIRQKYGDNELYRESKRRWGSYTKEQKQKIGEEGNAVYRDLVAAIPLGPADPVVQRCIARWHDHLRYFYEPPTEVLLGLGDMYNDHPDFRANFDRITPELAPFMREAIMVYVKSLEK